MSKKYYLYKASSKTSTEGDSAVKLSENDSLDGILDWAMMDIFTELRDGNGENSKSGSPWRNAKDIYDRLKSGAHYTHAGKVWWIEKVLQKCGWKRSHDPSRKMALWKDGSGFINNNGTYTLNADNARTFTGYYSAIHALKAFGALKQSLKVVELIEVKPRKKRKDAGIRHLTSRQSDV